MMQQAAADRDKIVDDFSRISSKYEVVARYSNQIEMKIPAAENVSVLSYCKNYGFGHLSNIACIDRTDDDCFEVMYNLWSYEHKVHCTLKTRVSRSVPVLVSIHSLWPQAQVYEQEIHEFFGVVFNGNPDLSPLFLHNWLDMPPMRKDFDSEEYARQAYGFLGEQPGESEDSVVQEKSDADYRGSTGDGGSGAGHSSPSESSGDGGSGAENSSLAESSRDGAREAGAGDDPTSGGKK